MLKKNHEKVVRRLPFVHEFKILNDIFCIWNVFLKMKCDLFWEIELIDAYTSPMQYYFKQCVTFSILFCRNIWQEIIIGCAYIV